MPSLSPSLGARRATAAVGALALAAWAVAACAGASPTPTPEPTVTPTATVTLTPSATPTNTATPTPTFPADAIVDARTLNLRAGPNTLHPIVEVLGLGTPVAVSGQSQDGTWLAVRSPADGRGWLNAHFVRLRKDRSSIPVVPTPTSPPTPTATAVPMDPAEPLVLAPPAVALGDPVLVRVRAPGATQALAVLGDQTVALHPAGGDAFAGVIGVPADAAPGEHAVHVTTVDGGGNANAQQAILFVHDADFAREGIELDAEHQRLLDPALRTAEAERLATEVWSIETGERMWQGTWAVPVTGTLSSPFGSERNYNQGLADSRHQGLDFRARPGTPVYAPAAGRVAFAGPMDVSGNAVWLDHGWGVQSGYLHLADIACAVGDILSPGAIIGTVGATGRVTGPHLHWEVRVHGVPVQPSQFLLRDVGAVP
jgi:hypothetical protein